MYAHAHADHKGAGRHGGRPGRVRVDGDRPAGAEPDSADAPVLVLWGDRDPFTPIDGPVGKFFSRLPSELPNVTLHMLEGVGHCPHDDRPDLVHDRLLPWLDGLPPPAAAAAAAV